MELTIAIVVLIVGGAAILLLSDFGKNPTRKTDSQLQRELALHDRVIATTDATSSTYQDRIAARNKVAEELMRRTSASMETNVSGQCGMAADEIRAVVSTCYEEGWRRAKAEGKGEKEALETALVSGLLNRVVGIDGWSSIAPEMVGAMAMEVIPFKFAGSDDECRQALIEYCVWRELPNAADTALVQQSITAMAEHMRSSGHGEFLSSLASLNVAWTKLLPA